MADGGGESKPQTTTQTSEPWSGVQPYLTSGYKDLSTLYKGGAPSYYPGNTVAQFAPETEQALSGTTARATQGTDPLNTASSGYLQNVLGGQYLGQHGPGWDSVVNAARQGADSSYSAAGRYGSGAHDTAVSGAIGQLAYQDYQNQLNRMDSAAALAPQVAGQTQAQDYTNLGQLGNVGAQRQAQGQANINADVQHFNYDQNKDYNWLAQYLGALNGSQGGSQTTTTPYNTPSPWTQILGAGLGVGGALLGGL